MSDQVFVIAGSYPQAVHWAHGHGVPPRDLVYLASEQDVNARTAGCRDGVFLCIGTWGDKPPWRLQIMFDLLAARGFTQCSEEEWEAARNG